MRRRQYKKEWAAQDRRKKCLERKRCEICKTDQHLIILDGRDKDSLSTTVLDRLKACCLSCLMQSQPLLTKSKESNKKS